MADSSALLAILLGEPEAAAFIKIINGVDKCLVSAVSLLETSIVLAGRSRDPSWAGLTRLIAEASIEIVPHDAALTEIARHAFLAYGKGRHPAALNMGDCATYALAKSRAAPLLFKGQDFTQTDLAAAL